MNVMKISFILCFVIIIVNSSSASGFQLLQGIGCLCFGSGGSNTKTQVENELKISRAVFSGEVIKVTKSNNSAFPDDVEITFKIRQHWKGIKKGTKAVMFLADDRGCRLDFKEGEFYLVYIADDRSSQEMRTNSCTRTRKLTDAKADLKILGKGKPVPDQTLVAPPD